jgi:hypothetical protein
MPVIRFRFSHYLALISFYHADWASVDLVTTTASASLTSATLSRRILFLVLCQNIEGRTEIDNYFDEKPLRRFASLGPRRLRYYHSFFFDFAPQLIHSRFILTTYYYTFL